ncbi:MAG: NTP transferase domain-containing protein, partial [Gemmatimonadota bacterium]|nr:NTP transferase domain-containing protein [Gemmatimonadota bacterium]
GDQTVLGRLLDSARAARVSDLLVAVRDAETAHDWLEATGHELDDVRLVEDVRVGLGPVAGLAALGAARGAAVAVLSADLPFVTAALIDGLLDELETGGEDAVIPRVEGRDQWLCAAYRSGVGEVASRLIADLDASSSAGPSVRDLLGHLSVRRIERVRGVAAGDLATACRGIDTPADLEWARSLAARGH